MRNFTIRLLINGLALAAAAYVVDGIHLTGGYFDILLVALVFGLVNAVLKPIVILLTLPAIFLTLGLFTFVVNGAMLLVTARLTQALAVDGLWAAILGSLVVSIVSMILGSVLDDDKNERNRQ